MITAMPEKICSVKGCDKESFQTVSADKVHDLFPLKEEKTKIHLCREHYKEFKRKTKKDRKLDRLDWVR